jgi:hypothetical protein
MILDSAQAVLRMRDFIRMLERNVTGPMIEIRG